MPKLQRPIVGKVMITGASGFIGSQLRDALLASGSEVVSLVRPKSPQSAHGRSVAVDYGDVASLRRAIIDERPDYLFHVAGATKGVTYEDFVRGNVMPTENLLRVVAEVRPQLARFVYVSSLTAFGPSNDGPAIRETDRPRPVEHYGRSKLAAERVVESFAQRVASTIVRPSTVYGPAESDMFVLFRAAKMGVNLFYGNREKQTSTVYVDDLLEALVSAAQSDATVGKSYFISDGLEYTWGQIQDHIGRAVGRRALTLNLPSFLVSLTAVAGEMATAVDQKPRLFNRQKALLDAQRAWLCSPDAAIRDFGFAPRVEMAEGTRRAYAWYREQGWL